MAHSDTQPAQPKKFLLEVLKASFRYGFSDYRSLLAKFGVERILSDLGVQERADVLTHSHMGRTACIELASLSAAVWMPIIKANEISAEMILTTVGADRLVDIVSPEGLWKHLTVNPFWRTRKESEELYTAAHGYVTSMIDIGFEQELLTYDVTLSGAVAGELLEHLSADSLQELGRLLLKNAGKRTSVSMMDVWSLSLPHTNVPLPVLFNDVVIGKITTPLGLPVPKDSDDPDEVEQAFDSIRGPGKNSGSTAEVTADPPKAN
jgi:hypothetical protein